MTERRRPAGDLIEAIVQNMRGNLEELRYTTIAPSRYTVYVSPAEYARLEGIIPRIQAEAVRALDEELDRQNRRGRWRRLGGRFLRAARPLENTDSRWHVELLPDMDGDLLHEQDIVVHSELILPSETELGSGERTRRITTVHSGQRTTSREPTPGAAPAGSHAHARLVYADQKGSHQADIVRDSTTIGRGGTMYPVDVRVATTDEVSREHARIRRDGATGGFFLIDLSTHGTSIDGTPIARGFDEVDGTKRENGRETALPGRARIGLAGTIFIDFERLS